MFDELKANYEIPSVPLNTEHLMKTTVAIPGIGECVVFAGAYTNKECGHFMDLLIWPDDCHQVRPTGRFHSELGRMELVAEYLEMNRRLAEETSGSVDVHEIYTTGNGKNVTMNSD